jgi:hypothetical protein
LGWSTLDDAEVIGVSDGENPITTLPRSESIPPNTRTSRVTHTQNIGYYLVNRLTVKDPEVRDAALHIFEYEVPLGSIPRDTLGFPVERR